MNLKTYWNYRKKYR